MSLLHLCVAWTIIMTYPVRSIPDLNSLGISILPHSDLFDIEPRYEGIDKPDHCIAQWLNSSAVSVGCGMEPNVAEIFNAIRHSICSPERI